MNKPILNNINTVLYVQPVAVIILQSIHVVSQINRNYEGNLILLSEWFISTLNLVYFCALFFYFLLMVLFILLFLNLISVTREDNNNNLLLVTNLYDGAPCWLFVYYHSFFYN